MFSTICGTVAEENEKTQGGQNEVLGRLGPFLRFRVPKLWCGMRHKTAGFYHVLSVSVVPSVSVERATECKMTC